MNVLVGANNAGKSSILDAFRALSGAFRYARTRLPERLRNHDGQLIYGYKIPESSIPVNPQNLQTDYSDAPSVLEFFIEGGEIIRLYLSKSLSPVLCFDSQRKITSLIKLKESFPTLIAVVPTLGPFEEQEELLNKEYVERWASTRRGHRLFRNYWLNQPATVFEEFKARLEATWNGMTVLRPEVDFSSKDVRMFAKEGRIDREVSWAGFGFQVWMQILTHLLSAQSASVLIIDEPEVYLHPDLQHKLFALLSGMNCQVILATHSIEIINDADADDLVVINKSNRHAKRLGDIDSIQNVIQGLGSTQNIVLSRLSASKRMLFFEGQDFRLVRKIAAKLGLQNLNAASDLHVVQVGGFTQAHKVENVSWTFKQILQTNIDVAALFDKDYRCKEENDVFLTKLRNHVPSTFLLDRKEIENYLLDIVAIEKAINDRLRERDREPVDATYVTSLIEAVTASFKSEVGAQVAAHKSRYLQNSGTKNDISTIITTSLSQFDKDWTDISNRLALIPGKSALAEINRALQKDLQINITESGIVKYLTAASVGEQFVAILSALDKFSKPS